MKCIDEIMDRAFAIFLTMNTALLDKEHHSGGCWPRAQRKAKKQEFQQVYHDRNMEMFTTPFEQMIIEASIETLTENNFQRAIWRYESLPSLLWVLQLIPFPEYDANIYKDIPDIFYEYRAYSEPPKLPERAKLRSEVEIADMLNLARLWHWRCVEWRVRPGPLPMDVDTALIDIFGENCKKHLEKITMTDDSPRDFVVGGIAFPELDATRHGYLQEITYWRHHALEWVLGVEDWDKTSADT